MFINNKPAPLGKKERRIDSRTLKLAKYLKVSAAPPEVAWIAKKLKPWGMLLNDVLGDCVPAAMGHLVHQWSWFANPPGFIPTKPEALAAYEAIGNYVPGNPSTDQGCDMLTALQYWKKTGFAGHSIDAYVSVDWTNATEVNKAIQLFGSLFLGIQLPISAQGQSVWEVPPEGTRGNGAPGSWGGHCVPILAVNPEQLTCVTWGGVLNMSQGFFAAYADECYACLSPDWISKSGLSPSEFDLAQLQADLAAL
jgi:hypothetical protein